MHKRLISIVSKNKLPSVLFAVGAFVRLFRIGSFATFLSDQGRDAIIVKQIVTLEHLPAIGPPTSLGHIFMGPFYYYLIAPFLFLGRLRPESMAVGVAILSLLGIGICYILIRQEYDRKIADIFLALTIFSAILVEYSRFSWNPNPLPYFMFIAIFAWHKALKEQNLWYAGIAGSLLALAVQLHYLAVFGALGMIVFFIIHLMQKNSLLQAVKLKIAAAVGLIFFSSPLIIFDLRHDFINSKNFLSLFGAANSVTTGEFSIPRMQETSAGFFARLVNIPITGAVAFYILIALAIYGIYVLIKKRSINLLELHVITIVLYIIGFSYLQSFRHPHYFMAIYLSGLLLLAVGIAEIGKNVHKNILFIFIALYIGIQGRNLYRLHKDPNRQIWHAETVAATIAEQINNKPYNIATWPIEFAEEPYLYFLQLRGLRPANRELTEITGQMYVLCNEEPCSIIDSPSWNISMFGPAKIAYKWKSEGIIIYKLVHEN